MADLNPLIVTLRDARTAQELSMRKCAKLAGLHPPVISQAEAGVYEPHLKNLIAWADALGYDLVLRPRDGGCHG